MAKDGLKRKRLKSLNPLKLEQSELFEIMILKLQVRKQYPKLKNDVIVTLYAASLWLEFRERALTPEEKIDGINYNLALDPDKVH